MNPFRLYAIFFLIIGAYATLAINLYDLQITKGSSYSARAKSQYRLAGFFEPHRGIISITDKTGVVIPIATNVPQRVVIAEPRKIMDKDAAVENLSPILKLDPESLRKLLSKDSLYQIILKDPTDEQVTAVTEAGMRGIQIDQREKRAYGLGSLASHIVGFVGASGDDPERRGRYGLEKHLESALAGTPARQENDETQKPIQGTEIRTTIDRAIQAQAEATIKTLVREKGASGGTVIVADPMTGKLLAIANAPDFDPNRYAEFPLSSFINQAVQGRYEPGSVFKIFTAAIGLDTGAITPDTTYYDSGSVRFKDGRTVKNWDLKAHGTVTMTGVIEESLNTGTAFMEGRIGHKRFYEHLDAFGFNDKTEIDLPGEVAGNLKNIRTHTADIDFAAASFGQGIAVTPIQLIAAAGAIANGGMLMKPLILADEDPKAVRRVISAKAAAETTAMMVSTVRKAKVADIPNYRIAGKTGTAQAVDFSRGGYTKDVINTYIGFAPASHPRFIVLIKLDKPAGAPLAGTNVVPAFRTLAEFLIDYYNIPPEGIGTEQSE